MNFVTSKNSSVFLGRLLFVVLPVLGSFMIDISYDKVAQGAKIRGASRIIGVEPNPEKSEKGNSLFLFIFFELYSLHQ